MADYTNAKRITGIIAAAVIFVLTVVAVLYEMFHLNLPVLDPIVALINDAHAFMTLVCVSFGVYAFAVKPRSYGLAALCSVDIVIINRLYSDKKWMSVIEWLRNSDKQMLFFWCIVIFLAVLGGYRAFKAFRAKAGKKTVEKNNSDVTPQNIALNVGGYTEKNDRVIGQTVVVAAGEANGAQIAGTDGVEPYKENEDGQDDNTKREKASEVQGAKLHPSTLCWLIVGTLPLFFGIGDFVVYEMIPLELHRPRLIEEHQDFIHFGALVGAVILMVFAVVGIASLWGSDIAKTIGNIISDRGSFGLSGILAFALEFTAVIIAIKGNNAKNIVNAFLDALANNWFAFVFALIAAFLILQIAFTILLHIFRIKEKGDDSNSLVSILKIHINNIEKKMIKLACGIVEGCVSLFDFIPDFFTTIGVLLLGQEEETSSDEEAKNEKEAKDKDSEEEQ